MNKLLYGVAYYYEYLPYDRLKQDIEMMKKAGINLVRIAESTWSTMEPQDGVFDFSTVDLVLDAMFEAGIHVIIGTPTYAIPAWLAKTYPEILANTPKGKKMYGERQNMDITHPVYLFHSERIIRKLISHIKDHEAIIGYQVDNETKHYETSGENIQLKFIKYMREKFKSTDNINSKFGLNYWSNRIDSWENFPSVNGTINASLACEFSKFQRTLVTDFLAWQASIVNEYKKDCQFITHNFDFDWKEHSFGVQPDVDHFAVSDCLDIVGIDVYHPSQDYLTGCEIAFCGDSARSYKNKNYFVLETQAQGHAPWLPYPGQLRLQAFSHLASGANMVEYWHYHSIHNSFETYWKGLLSHDFKTNPTYEEAITIGADFKRLSSKLINLKKENKVALLISNESLSAFNWFKMYTNMDYNDYTRRMYDALYKLNIECDMISSVSDDLDKYSLLVIPPLYAVADNVLNKLNNYVTRGGNVIYGMRSGFSDENCTVRNSEQPGIILEVCGIKYSQFTAADSTCLKGGGILKGWIELLNTDSAETLYLYDHSVWGEYSAVTMNISGKGSATYIGCFPDDRIMENIILYVIKKRGLIDTEQNYQFPIIIRKGVNQKGHLIRFCFNYSSKLQEYKNLFSKSTELISGKSIDYEEIVKIPSWGIMIFEER